MSKRENKKSIVTKRDFESYLNEMKKYSEKISNGEVSHNDSLISLMRSGICDKEKNINKAYLL